jgi:hypothetical protein
VKRPFLFAAVVLTAPLGGAQPPAHPADPSVPVPAPVYRSVFGAAEDTAAAPPGDWRQANAEVARFPRGHADIVRWENEQARAAAATAANAPPPAASGPAHPHGDQRP